MNPPVQQVDTGRLHKKPDEAAPLPVEKPPAPADAQPESPPSGLLTGDEIEALREKIIAALCTCFDPEIPVNIYELGLIYDIAISPEAIVETKMTLTSPGCPAALSLPPEVKHKIESVAGVRSAKVDVVWDPPWDKSRMSEAAKLQLGIEDW